jgi:mannosylglycoprotein endo-beta-mannosidase
MAKIWKEELQATLQIFQVEICQGRDGILAVFYLECFEFIRKDLLGVLKYSRSTGKILPAFNSTFIDLSMKDDNLHSFYHFLPISLCNNIYKIISNIISLNFLNFLLKHISSKKFEFLKGRQIHELIALA